MAGDFVESESFHVAKVILFIRKNNRWGLKVSMRAIESVDDTEGPVILAL